VAADSLQQESLASAPPASRHPLRYRDRIVPHLFDLTVGRLSRLAFTAQKIA
jgi:hypothetical protein